MIAFLGGLLLLQWLLVLVRWLRASLLEFQILVRAIIIRDVDVAVAIVIVVEGSRRWNRVEIPSGIGSITAAGTVAPIGFIHGAASI